MPELMVRTFEAYDAAIADAQDRGYVVSQESGNEDDGVALMFRPSDGMSFIIVWEPLS